MLNASFITLSCTHFMDLYITWYLKRDLMCITWQIMSDSDFMWQFMSGPILCDNSCQMLYSLCDNLCQILYVHVPTLSWQNLTVFVVFDSQFGTSGFISGGTDMGSSWPQNWYWQNTKLDRFLGKPLASRIFTCKEKNTSIFRKALKTNKNAGLVLRITVEVFPCMSTTTAQALISMVSQYFLPKITSHCQLTLNFI